MSRKRRHHLHPLVVGGLLRQLKSGASDERPLAVGGAPSLAAALGRELSAGGDARAVRTGSLRGALGLVYVLTGPPGEPELRDLHEASRAGVPIVAVTSDASGAAIPYVLATHVVTFEAAQSPPVAEVARAVARALGHDAATLAGRLPVLRDAVSERLIELFARKNGLIGAAVFVPGVDMPLMTLNQMRLVMRLAAAHGLDPEPQRALELLGVLGGGFGLRMVGRSLVGLVPVGGWAIKAGVGYAGTVAVGQAAVRYYGNAASEA